MREETKSIGFACALGAFVGALLALEFKTWFQYGMYLWPIVALIGGSVAYVAVDFREFCSGVARAYRTTIAWRPYVPFWKAYGVCILGAIAASLSAGMIGTIFVLGIRIPGESTFIASFTTMCLFSTSSMLIFMLCICLLFAICSKEQSHELKESGMSCVIHGNPISVIYYGLKGLWYITLRIPKATIMAMSWICLAGQLAKRFAIKAFVYVHSDRRTICFVDSILGATAGFFYGSATLGAFVGAVLGMVNYEIVTVRWLKLVPARVE